MFVSKAPPKAKSHIYTLCTMEVRRLILPPPLLLRRIFVVSALLCMIVPVTWVLLRRDPLEHDTDYTKKDSWQPKPPFIITATSTNTRGDIVQQSKPSIKRPVDQGVLLLYKYRSSSDFRNIKTFLRAHRINHDTYLMSMTRHAPKLVRPLPTAGLTSHTSTAGPVGRYKYIIIIDVFNFMTEGSIHGLFTEYCRGFDAIMILLASGRERNIASLLPPTGQTFEDDISMLILTFNVHHLRIHQTNNEFIYTKDGGEWEWNTISGINRSSNALVGFWPHKRSLLSDTPDIPYSEQEVSTRLRTLASAHYTDPNTKSNQRLPVAVIDRGSTDGIQRVYFGIPLSIAITKLLLMEVLHMYSNGVSPVIRTGIKRWIQVDIDDVFVAPMGSKMRKYDVEVRTLL